MGFVPKVSVIILNHNGRTHLGGVFDNCIRSVLNSDYPNLELILVDNGSSDDSVEHIMRNHADPRLRIIKIKRNTGFDLGNNVGAQASSGDILIFMNNDCVILSRDLISKIVGFIADHGDVLVGPHGGRSYRCSIMGSAIPMPLRSKKHEISRILVPRGYFLVITRKLFDQVLGFDPMFFFAGCEEEDLYMRVNLMGYASFCWAEIDRSVKHIRSQERLLMRGLYQRYLIHYDKSQLIIMLKNLELATLVRSLPVKLLIYLIHVVYNMIFSRERALHKLRAIWYVNFKLRTILKTRALIQAKRRFSDSRLLNQGVLCKGKLALATEVWGAGVKALLDSRWRFGSLSNTQLRIESLRNKQSFQDL